jgi:hypothetical protein
VASNPKPTRWFPRAPYQSKIVEAYHATTAASAKKIVEQGHFHPSDNPWDWLGAGAYFFETEHRAREWALDHFPEDPMIVHVKVKLGHSIDLDDNRWAPALHACWKEVEKTNVVAKNRGLRHDRDRVVLDKLATIWRPDTIRSSFEEGVKVLPQSEFTERKHAQLLVRNQENCIRIVGLIRVPGASQDGR